VLSEDDNLDLTQIEDFRIRYDEYLLTRTKRYRGVAKKLFDMVYTYNVLHSGNEKALAAPFDDPNLFFKYDEEKDLPRDSWFDEVVKLVATGIPAEVFQIGFNDLMNMDLYEFEMIKRAVTEYQKIKEEAQQKSKEDIEAKLKQQKGKPHGSTNAF